MLISKTNKMKNIKHIILALSGFFLVTSCDRELDINPAQSITTGQAISTPENINNILVGTYAITGRADLFGGDTQMYADLLGNSEYVDWYGTYAALRQIYTKNIVSDNAYVRDTWQYAYKAIYQTNVILDNLNVVTDTDDKTRIEGEAKFLRAINYFELVRYFGKQYVAGSTNTQLGVPIVLSSKVDFSGDLSIARNTVEEVYAQVIKDLTEAIAKLPSDNSYYADVYTAKALLARVYLQKGDYANARAMSNDVIANSGRSLVGSFDGAFNTVENTSEDLFATQVTSQSGINDLNTFYADDIYGGRGGDIAVRDEYVDLFEASDVRGDFFHYNVYGDRLSSKFKNQFGNVHVIRLAEMYLIRAEANLALSTSVGATPLSDINLVRNRAHASSLSAVTQADIMEERSRELGFEGFLIHDIKRTKGSVGSLSWNSDKLVFPIPLREMQVNNKLVQNPGYN
jgi:hypothetical protein